MIGTYSKRKVVLAILTALLLEVAMFPMPHQEYFKIDFFIILLIFQAFYINREKTLFVALALGLLQDLFSNSLFGVGIFSYGVTSLYLMWMTKKFDRESGFVIACATVASFMSVFLISLLFHWSTFSNAHAVTSALIRGGLSLMWTSLAAYPTVRLLSRVLTYGSRQFEFRF